MNAHALPAPETIANIEAEQALLGTLLVNSSLYDTLHTFGIEARHFSEAMHGHIFDACGKLIEAGKAANPVTVRGYIPDDLNVGGATPAQYLARLATSSSMGASHLGGLAQAVIHAWMRREMLGTSQAMAQMAQDALGDMELADGLQALQTRLMECQRALDGEQAEGVSMADAVVSSMDQTYAAVKRGGSGRHQHGHPGAPPDDWAARPRAAPHRWRDDEAWQVKPRSADRPRCGRQGAPGLHLLWRDARFRNHDAREGEGHRDIGQATARRPGERG
jgi:hypothetical protein